MPKYAKLLGCVLAVLCCASAHADFPRGAVRSPAHKLLQAPAHRVLADPPDQFALIPAQLDMWGNNQFGDCVTAEECFAKACHQPEIFVTAAEAESWAQAHGYLNGADLVSVLTTMQTDGLTTAGGVQYNDGPYATVDYSNETVLRSAIATAGPVKIAIDAGALPSTAGQQQGWFARCDGKRYTNTDHCVSICGYGPAEFLYTQLNVQMPPALAGVSGYYVFTWATIGFVDHHWLMSTCTEAFVRNPVTVVAPQPTPAPPAPHRVTFAEELRQLLREIIYRRAVRDGLIPPGTPIGAVDWQKVIKLIQELEPIIIPLIPLLVGQADLESLDPSLFELHPADHPFAPAAALCAHPKYRKQCGPRGCHLVPVEEEDESHVDAPAEPAAPKPTVKRRSPRKCRRGPFRRLREPSC